MAQGELLVGTGSLAELSFPLMQIFRPKEFAKQSTVADGDESEDESVIGKMPPAEDESSET